ncbi:MAG: hypothetical protein ACKVT0_00760 [Planctomycetaceae bacterium]
MSVPEQILVLLNLGFGIAAFGLIFGKLFPRARRENFQQDLFKIRNDLFLFMKENGYSFDDPAYRDIRATLNAVIRYCEFYSFPGFFLSAFQEQNERVPVVDLIEQVADEQLKIKLRSVRREISLRVFRFLFWSVHAVPCIFIVFAYEVIKEGKRTIKPIFKFIFNRSENLRDSEPISGIAMNLADAFTTQAQQAFESDSVALALGKRRPAYCKSFSHHR